MKCFPVFLVALALMMSTSVYAAEDGAALYKSKCSSCHGPNGDGKVAPKVIGHSAENVAKDLSSGVAPGKAPHKAKFPGLNDDQIKAISDYVAGLK